MQSKIKRTLEAKSLKLEWQADQNCLQDKMRHQQRDLSFLI